MEIDFSIENPIGTKFLVEVEVTKNEGYGNIVACACHITGQGIGEKFEELTGVKVTKVYKKDITTESNSLEDNLKNALSKIQALRQQGYNI